MQEDEETKKKSNHREPSLMLAYHIDISYWLHRCDAGEVSEIFRQSHVFDVISIVFGNLLNFHPFRR